MKTKILAFSLPFYLFLSIKSNSQTLTKEILISSDSTENYYFINRAGLKFSEKEDAFTFYMYKKVNFNTVSTGGSEKLRDFSYITEHVFDKNNQLSEKNSAYYNFNLDPNNYFIYSKKKVKMELPEEKKIIDIQKSNPDAFINTESTAKTLLSLGNLPAQQSTNQTIKLGGLSITNNMNSNPQPTVGPEGLVFSKSFYKYSLSANAIIDTSVVSYQAFTHEEEQGGSATVAKGPSISQSENTITYLYNVKKDGSKGYDYMKDYAIKIYGKDGKVVGKSSFTFDFVKNPSYFDQAYSYNQNGEKITDGYVAIFEKAYAMGKYNDPDKTVFNIVYVDKMGKEVLNYKFNVGLEKPGFQAFYSFTKDNVLYVFGKIIEKENEFVLLKFGKTGVESSTKFSSKILTSLTVGTGKLGLRSSYGQSLETKGHIFTKNGTLLIYGFNKYENASSGGQLGQGVNSISTSDIYTEPLVLQFSPQLEIVKQYALAEVKTAVNKGSEFNMIEEQNNVFKFIIQKPTKPVSFKYDEAGFKTTLLSIDLNNTSINPLDLSGTSFEGFFNLGYKYFATNKKLILSGKNTNGRYQVNIVNW